MERVLQIRGETMRKDLMSLFNPIWILTIILLLVIAASYAMAATKDRGIMNITNCYNVTVHYDLTDGVAVPVSFVGCTDKGDGTWFCKCREDDNLYTLTMRTDSAVIRDAREYDIDITGYVYKFFEDDMSFRVLDWGDYIENKGKHTDDFGVDVGDSDTCSDRVEVIYINKTVEVPVEVPVEVIKEVRVEDTTKINALNKQLGDMMVNNSKLHADNVAITKKADAWQTATWIAIVGIIGLIGYMYYRGGF